MVLLMSSWVFKEGNQYALVPTNVKGLDTLVKQQLEVIMNIGHLLAVPDEPPVLNLDELSTIVPSCLGRRGGSKARRTRQEGRECERPERRRTHLSCSTGSTASLHLGPLNGTEEGSDKRAKEGMTGYLFEIKSVLG